MSTVRLAVLGLLAFAAPTARADIIGPGQSPGQDQPPAPELALPAGEKEVDEAIKLFRQRDLDATLAKLEEASKAKPDLGPPRLLLAKLLLIDNQTQPGRALLERVAVESPESPDLWLTLGKIALAEGRLAEAVTLFEKSRGLLEAAKLSDAHKRTLKIEALAGLANAAERRQDWPGAEAATRAWLAEDAGSVEARRRIAQAFYFEGKVDQAAKEFKRVQGLDPSAVPPAVALAVLATEQNRPDAAEKFLKDALATQAGDARIHRAYAAWLLDRGRPDEARAAIEKAEAIDSRSDDIRLLAALIDLRNGKLTEAEAVLEELHGKAPGNFVISDRWARALIRQDDPAKRRRAQQIAEMNLRLNPKNPQAISTGALVAHTFGNDDQAESMLRSVMTSGSATSEIAYELARLVAERRGETAPEVASLLKIALDAAGPFPHREEAKTWLGKLPTPAPAPAASAASTPKPAARP